MRKAHGEDPWGACVQVGSGAGRTGRPEASWAAVCLLSDTVRLLPSPGLRRPHLPPGFPAQRQEKPQA